MINFHMYMHAQTTDYLKKMRSKKVQKKKSVKDCGTEVFYKQITNLFFISANRWIDFFLKDIYFDMNFKNVLYLELITFHLNLTILNLIFDTLENSVVLSLFCH